MTEEEYNYYTQTKQNDEEKWNKLWLKTIIITIITHIKKNNF
jgi:hypothetical protein